MRPSYDEAGLGVGRPSSYPGRPYEKRKCGHTGRPSDHRDRGEQFGHSQGAPRTAWPHQEWERGLEQILPRSLQEGRALPDLDLTLLAFLGGQGHPPGRGGEGVFQHQEPGLERSSST